MEYQKRIGLRRSLLACATISAMHIATIPCRAQAPVPQPSTAASAPGAPPSRTLPTVDPQVRAAGFHGEYASSQQMIEQTPPAPSKPQPSAPVAQTPNYPVPQYTPAAPTAPQYVPYAPAYAPQYVPVAPTYAPMTPTYAPVAPTYAPVAPSYAPVAPSYAPVAPGYYAPAAPAYGPPAQPANGNFFLPSAPGPAPAYAPQMAPVAPTYAIPMAPMMPVGPQPAAVGNGAALTGSSVSVPTSSSTTSVQVRGPGMIGMGLARFGERLTQLGRTRVRTVQETVLQTPQSQPVGGTATIATTGTTPVQAPVAPMQPQAPQVPQAPEAPTPSPQGTHQKHPFFRHLFGHE